jgi:hypothetical protein
MPPVLSVSTRMNQPARKGSPIVIAILLALAVGGAVLMAVGIVGISAASGESGFVAVKAEIVDVDSGPHKYHSDGPRPGDRVGTRITVTYRYEVDGESFTSTRYSSDEAHDDFAQGSEKDAAERLAKLRKRNTLTVYVDPSDASQAVIARAETAPAIVATVFGACAVLFFGVFGVVAWRRRG